MWGCATAVRQKRCRQLLSEAVTHSEGPRRRLQDRGDASVPVARVGFVSILHVTPDEESHRAAGEYVRRIMLARRVTRSADYGGEAVSDVRHPLAIAVFAGNDRGVRPRCNGMT